MADDPVADLVGKLGKTLDSTMAWATAAAEEYLRSAPTRTAHYYRPLVYTDRDVGVGVHISDVEDDPSHLHPYLVEQVRGARHAVVAYSGGPMRHKTVLIRIAGTDGREMRSAAVWGRYGLRNAKKVEVRPGLDESWLLERLAHLIGRPQDGRSDGVHGTLEIEGWIAGAEAFLDGYLDHAEERELTEDEAWLFCMWWVVREAGIGGAATERFLDADDSALHSAMREHKLRGHVEALYEALFEPQ